MIIKLTTICLIKQCGCGNNTVVYSTTEIQPGCNRNIKIQTQLNTDGNETDEYRIG